jgi:DNA invertase Pin-like site-specific DNA recombinase
MTHGTKRAAIYLRTSTDGQTTENQRLELEGMAHARGWRVVKVYEDAGVSGAKSRDRRPGLDAMLKDASRRRFDVVMVWALDRLGRSLAHLIETADHLQGVGVDLFLSKQAIDTTNPRDKLFFHITGAFAEYERSVIKERVHAGLARARAEGKRLGRQPVDDKTVRAIVKARGDGLSVRKTAAKLGVGVATVHRVLTGRHISQGAHNSRGRVADAV